jgi:GPN-loop GTPase
MEPTSIGSPSMAPSDHAVSTSSSEAPRSPKPTSILVIGMAGSGKTSLIQRLNSHLHAKKTSPYIINLDPAVTHVPYSPNIDIRDTVKYKVSTLILQSSYATDLTHDLSSSCSLIPQNVMKEFNLGPNGAILTACNLFATRFDQVMGLLEKPRSPPLEYIITDTPGQIEIFTWSASGQIITELMATSFPTLIAYVIDTPRCLNPQTFMSNMLQACSILYKSKLPMLLVFNKIDAEKHSFAMEWMSDFDAYSAALDKDASYASTLSRSLSLVLEEFYQNLTVCGVSALTGEGMEDFFKGVAKCSVEYEAVYLPELDLLKKEKAEREARRNEKEMKKLKKDLANSSLDQDSFTKEEGTPIVQRPEVSVGQGVRGEDDDDGCDYEIDDDGIEEDEGRE